MKLHFDHTELINTTNNTKYNFLYRYELDFTIMASEVFDWCKQSGVACFKIGKYYYFETENDKIQFLLRFA